MPLLKRPTPVPRPEVLVVIGAHRDEVQGEGALLARAGDRPSASLRLVTDQTGKAHALSSKFGQERLLKALFALIAACLFGLTFTDNAILSVALIVMIAAAYPLCQPALEEIQQKSVANVNRATMMSIFALVMELAAAGENALVSSAAGMVTTRVKVAQALSLRAFTTTMAVLARMAITIK